MSAEGRFDRARMARLASRGLNMCTSVHLTLGHQSIGRLGVLLTRGRVRSMAAAGTGVVEQAVSIELCEHRDQGWMG